MAQIGALPSNIYYENRVNRDNVIVNRLYMPQDGWITRMRMEAGAQGARSFARFGIWGPMGDYSSADEIGDLIYAANQQEWSGGLTIREAELPGIAVRGGTRYGFGVWTHPEYPVRWGAGRVANHVSMTHVNPKAPPETFRVGIQYDRSLSLEADYVPNARPLQSEWRGDTPNGPTGDQDPVFSATLPHPEADSEYDFSTRVQVLIRDRRTGKAIYNETFAVTREERDQGYWNRVLRVLAPGGAYDAITRHYDRFGLQSAWSARINFSITSGPNRPTVTRPDGLIAWLNEAESPYNVMYSGEHTHPTDEAPGAVQVQVYTYDGQNRLYDSGWRVPLVGDPNPGDESYIWYLAQFHEDFVPGAAYAVRVKTRSLGIESGWSGWSRLVTNAQPNRPEPIQPVGGKASPDTLLQARISDPHPASNIYGNDTIERARAYLYDSTSTLVAGYPKDMNIVSGGTVAELDVAADITLGNDYSWQCDVYDGARPTTNEWWSEKSDIASWEYRAVPNVDLLTPSAGVLVNLPTDPSFEYGTFTPTKNLLSYNQSSVEVDTTGLAAYQGSSISRDVTVFHSGEASLKVDLSTSTASVDGGMRTANFGRPSVPAGEQVISSAWVKGPAGERLRAFTAGFSNSGAYLGAFGFTPFITLTGDWQRIVSVPGTDDTQSFVPVIYMQSEVGDTYTFWADDLQIERGTDATPWEAGEVETFEANVVSDGDAAFGAACLEAVGYGGVVKSKGVPVSTTRPAALIVSLKKVSGVADAYVYAECLDDSSTVLGTVTPTGASSLSGTDVDGDWSRYGGVVDASQWPVGTTRTRLVVEPSRSTEATVRVDALYLVSGPGLSEYSLPWLGYFDGDTEGYGSAATKSYEWVGIEGNSASRGINRLISPNADVSLSYSSSTGAAKVDDRLVIEQQDPGSDAYEPLYDSGWGGNGGDRIAIPLPGGFVKNEGRYRLKAYVRDAGGLESESGWAHFDVEFEGISELDIYQASSEPDNATITVSFEPTDLLAVEFVGVEVEISQPQGPPALHLIEDYSADQFTYHFPVSGYNHRFRIRQVGMIGAEQIEGPWREIYASCDYYPMFFLKDAEVPETLNVPFKVLKKSLPTWGPRQPRKLYHTWGSEKPKAATTSEYHESGTVNVTILHEGIHPGGRAQEDYLGALKEMHRDGRVVALLSQKTSRKRFVSLTSDTAEVQITEIEDYSIDLEYSEVTYSEDYRKRGIER